jgi:methylenetetrahydrofolate reductase (NADPH)
MKITDLIKEKGKSLSFEFFPPIKPIGEERLLERITRLQSFSPSFVSVTQHARPDSLARTKYIVEKIHKATGTTTMPHITCAEPRKSELMPIIEYYKAIGIDNILALRGDREEYGENAFNGNVHFSHATELVHFISGYNNFCVGVAVYPEGHPESSNLGIDTAYIKTKIENGADFGITQMFFENFYFYQMMDRFTQNGINFPVIAGIMPITDIEKVEHFADMSGVELPITTIKMFEELENPEDVLKAGIDLCTEQCLDLWENGVRYFHFYTLNHDEAVTKILNNLASTLNGNPF